MAVTGRYSVTFEDPETKEPVTAERSQPITDADVVKLSHERWGREAKVLKRSQIDPSPLEQKSKKLLTLYSRSVAPVKPAIQSAVLFQFN